MTGPATIPSDDAGECAFHPRHHDHDADSLEHIALVEQAMNPRDAHVVDPLDADAQHPQRLRAFLGDRQVPRSGADEGHGALAQGRDGSLLDGRGPRELDVGELRERRTDCGRLLAVEPRDEHVLARACELPRNPHDLGGRLSVAQDYLGNALADGPMVVDRRVTQIGVGQVLQLGQRVVDGRLPLTDAIEERAKPP